jgi:Spy/CpxP family protein refolding chaperone
MGMVPLLQIDSVKQELKLEGDQTAQVESLTVQIREDFADQLRELMQSLREAGPEDRQQLREKLSDVTGQINERLTTVLQPEQMGRLKQINLQLGLRRGDGAEELTNSDIATALDLTSEQQQQLRDQANEARNQPERQIPTLAEARDEVNKILTPEQQEKLDNLLGTEFDLPAAMLEGGRQRGFRRGPQAEGEPSETAPSSEGEQPALVPPAE